MSVRSPEISDWRRSGIRHVAHRCGGWLAPENTLEGMQCAAARGFRAVEFDVMLSADGTPILMHDETLDRTTDGRGSVASTSSAALSRLQANRGREAEWPGARIPTLSAAIATCARLGLAMNIEIKPAAGHDEATAHVVADVLRREFVACAGVPLPIVSSFSETALAVARDRLPDLPRGLLVSAIPDDWPLRMSRLACTALHAAATQPQADRLDDVLRGGIPVRCFTVNDQALARALFSRGVEAIFTDAVDLFAPDAG